MRDITRIDPFLEELGKYWKKLPDWRFGQLINNFMCHIQNDLFYLEDNKLLQKFKEYMESMGIKD